jgi:hypothetical protein
MGCSDDVKQELYSDAIQNFTGTDVLYTSPLIQKINSCEIQII